MGPAMKILNRTRYLTADLARFFRAGLEAAGTDGDRTIEVLAGRRPTACRGRASIGAEMAAGRWIRLWAPASLAGDEALGNFARVFEHELAHNLGLRHDEMDDETYNCSGGLPEWARGFEIRLKVAKATLDPAVAREAHARAMMVRWERRVAAARKRLARWKRAVTYYDRKRAVAIAAGGQR